LDDNDLMRMAGRFARRVKAWGAANQVPVIYCKSGERKHRIAEEYLATHDSVRPGVFLVLVAKAPATVWQVHRSPSGVIGNIAKKSAYVNHYSFHLMDPQWGHVTIKMSGHPPFAAQVMLNGHEYVGCQARAAGIDFSKDGNCSPRSPPRTTWLGSTNNAGPRRSSGHWTGTARGSRPVAPTTSVGSLDGWPRRRCWAWDRSCC